MACAYLSGLFFCISIKWNFDFFFNFFYFSSIQKNLIFYLIWVYLLSSTPTHISKACLITFFFSSVLFPTKGSYLASHPWLAKCKMFALKKVSFKFLNYENGNKINA